MFSTATKTKLDAFSLPPKWVWRPQAENFRNVFYVGGGGALGKVKGVEVKPKPSAFLRQLGNSIVVSFCEYHSGYVSGCAIGIRFFPA